MAMFNEVLAPRFNELISRLLGMKGSAAAPQLSGDIMPAIILENDRFENRYLARVFSVGGGASQAAAGALQSTIRIRNPMASGQLFVIEGFFVSSSVAGEVTCSTIINTNAAIAGVDGAIVRRDGRQSLSAMLISLGNVAPGAGSNIARQLNGASVPMLCPSLSIVLMPGQAVDFSSTAVNTIVDATWWGYTRVLLESEGVAV